MADPGTTLRAGLLWGVGAIAWTLFEFAMGWHNEHPGIGAKTGFVAIVFPVIAIVWALGKTRQAAGGVLGWRSALATGLAVSAVSAAIGLAFFAIYYTLINPEFVAASKARGAAVDVPSQLVTGVVGSLAAGMAITRVATLLLQRGGRRG